MLNPAQRTTEAQYNSNHQYSMDFGYRKNIKNAEAQSKPAEYIFKETSTIVDLLSIHQSHGVHNNSYQGTFTVISNTSWILDLDNI